MITMRASFKSFFPRSILSDNMSARSSMATSSRSGLPERLAAALALRSAAHACPDDVERALSAITFFRGRASAPAAPRFGRVGGGGGGDSGRFASFRGPPPRPHVSEDGFETVMGGARKRGGGSGGGGGGGMRSGPGPSPLGAPSGPPAAGGTGTATPAALATAGAAAAASDPAPGPAKFSSAAVRAADVEDRMLVRVKGKINRLGHGTYDATKVFMQQILSSDDTDFLDELMKFIFTKASSEPAYCPLYAKMLHELGDEFPHFRVVIRSIFTDYINVFREVDAGTEPDPGSADYEAYKNAQERKRERRGYSQFVAELVKLGEADVGDFETLLRAIVGVIETNYGVADKTLMCEEYIDCFGTMCGTASAILRAASWSADLVRHLSVIAAKPKKDAPSISNKARFAIMAIADSADAGWAE
jgi:hypothetical protein